MNRSNEEAAVKIRHHAVKLMQYAEKHIGNSAMAMATLTIVFKDLLNKARTKNGDAYAQNLLQGFLSEFQAGGWIPVAGEAQLKAVNRVTGGVVYESTGMLATDGKPMMQGAVYVEANDEPIQTGEQQIHLPCWYHPCAELPMVREEDAPVPE